jgi:hypothetical protein
MAEIRMMAWSDPRRPGISESGRKVIAAQARLNPSFQLTQTVCEQKELAAAKMRCRQFFLHVHA